jgi:sugar/nucleoside kinase (ribokinase family)
VSVVGVVGDDFPLEQLAFLEARGVRLQGLEKVAGKTFRWAGKYGFDLNAAQTLDTQLNVFESFQPKLDPIARSADRVFLGNIHPALQLQVLEQFPKAPKLVAADTMNFWISGERATLLKLLRRVDVLLVNDGEARQLAGESNVIKAAKAIHQMGPRTVVIKRGEYGALLFQEGTSFHAPAFPLSALLDPTGAGDTFAGGFLGLLDRLDDQRLPALKQAVVMGSTLASFNVESFSFDRLRDLPLRDVLSRFGSFRHLTHFEELSTLGD